MTTLTTNISLNVPANGSFDDDWDVPVNQNWNDIDNCVGGTTIINVTGGLAGTTQLSVNQYTPRNIEFLGTLSANLVYVVPSGVGGTWSLGNGTTNTGSFTIFFGVSGGGSLQLAAGFRTLLNCDGLNVGFADNAPAAASLAEANAFTTAAVAAERTTAANASNLSSGTVPNAQLPNPGIGPGVTIAPDPGTVPTGPAGSIFYYY
jgi:hypothetical protein